MSASTADLPRPSRASTRGTPRPSKRTRWRAAVLIAVHVAIGLHIAQWQLSGSTITPIEPSEAGETLTLGYVNAGFIALLLMILSTLVFGRFFCGWACHVVALQDASAALLKRIGLKPAPIRSRFLVLIPLLAAIEMFVLPSLLRWWEGGSAPEFRAAFTTTDFWGRFPGLWTALLTFAVDGFVIVYFLGAKGFCTYGCPYGALFGIADRFAPGRIRVTDACEGCGHCTATCTSNVDVRAEVAQFGAVVDAGCMKCLDCVSVCPKDALYFGFRASSSRAPSGSKAKSSDKGKRRSKRSYDFSLGEEIALLAVFAGAFYAFRNLYGRIPFLLAIGSAVLVALAALSLWRALRSRDFRLQHLAVRRGGRWTGLGRVVALSFAGLLFFTTHSAAVQYHARRGRALLEDATSLPAGSPQRTAGIDASLAHLEFAGRWGLLDDPRQLNPLGQILGARGDFERARDLARRSLAVSDEQVAPRLQLIDLALFEGDLDRAVAELAALLERHPQHDGAEERLLQVIGADLQRVDAHLLLVRSNLARGLEAEARMGLDWILQTFPENGEARELAAE